MKYRNNRLPGVANKLLKLFVDEDTYYTAVEDFEVSFVENLEKMGYFRARLVFWYKVLSLSIASFFPTLLAFAERRMQISGKMTSWFGMSVSLGAMTLPFLIGQLFEPFGPKVTMTAILIDLLAGFSIFAVLVIYSAGLKK